jgi:ABC-2 type transport system permease protein
MIGVELRKQAFRTRTYIGFGIMAAIPVIFTLAFKFGGGPRDRGDRDFFLVARHSGINMPLAALSAMSTFLLPVVVALFFGESVSGEANWGTLRYLLLRPVSRFRLLGAKLAVGSLLALAAVALIVFAGLAAGTAAFGWHDVLTPSFAIFPPGHALALLGVSAAYVAWSMSGVAAFAFLLSTMTDTAVGAVAGGVGLGIVSEILNGISALGVVRYGLPTHYWQAWNGLFVVPSRTADMVRGTLLQIPYFIAFVAFAWWWFRRKDVLS